ncbi:hypothetical protein OG756_41590 (plasmid) [Streptomyces sp. NBC_01310]|uniref:hypothetical protein n=1 Tax=Streptomyces TaxID=1883 RepID=UPI0022526C1D|nr:MULTISPECIES: hypothetical protein [Streptomyces]MCX5278032.1 hypothetical protein [Streptomyces virginiae]WSJ64513.1 hypothetical protein OG756_41590 [Streptomyces sp. NBC_01310]
MIDDLRAAALRAIHLLEQPDGGRGNEDMNPHTRDVSAYSLASMLTFGRTRDQDSTAHLVHMVFGGKPERIESRRRWVAWELDRLGYAEASRLLSDMTRDESLPYMQRGLPLTRIDRPADSNLLRQTPR